MMTLDGGILLKYYCFASIFLWPILLVSVRRCDAFSVSGSVIFRASPLLLFILGFIVASVLEGLR